MASPAHSSSSSDDDAAPSTLPPLCKQVNVHSHVPVVLDLNESNYSQWRCFFDSVLGKFGLGPHVFSPPPLDQRDTDWVLNDHSVVNWLCTTINKGVSDIVYHMRSSAFSI
jgi:hypothetical protein